VTFPPADDVMMHRHVRFLAEAGVLPNRSKTTVEGEPDATATRR
jgi:hypothetical protein